MKLKDYLPELPGFVRNQQQMSELANILNLSKSVSGESARLPSLGSSQTFINSWLRQQMAYRQQMCNDLMMLALTVEEIRSPLNHLSGEVFRRGLHWAPKFVQRCAECNIEFNEFMKQCPKCQTGDLEEPDPSQKERFDKFMPDCNIWSQSLEEVLRFFYFDLNAIDDAYLYIAKEYFAPQDGDPIRSRVLEVRRLNPAAVELDLNAEGLPKAQTWVCYMHRPTAQMSGATGTYGSTPTPTTAAESMITQAEPGNCDECGRELVPAMYKYLHQGATQYLLDDEVIHVKKFHHDETYGWSPILTIFEKVLSIKGMDQFVYRYFFERKMPASMVMVFTDDPESLRRERENISAKMRMDPHYVPMIAVSSRQSRGRVDMVRMFHTLQEMDYLPVRQEIRERIASMWGVTPAWQGAPEAVGGLSTQTQQLVVMSRVVEADQKLFHEKVFPKLLEAFGVTDWVLQLLQPEEKAEATRLSFAQQRISAANMLFQMGFDVTIKSENVGVDEVRFLVSGEAQQQDPYGGMGMMGGIGGGGEEGSSMNGNGGGGESPFQLMVEKSGNDTWVGQIEKAGHMGAVLHGMSESGDALFFTSKGIDHIAKFNNGTLVDIEKIMRDRMHRHENYPPHDINMPHDTLARKRKAESLLEADEPEEMDDLGI